jgi:thiamine-phosphate pyrophosphorylase
MGASPKPSDPPPAPFFYPIVDTDACAEHGRDPLAVVVACLRGGARWLQLRGTRAGSASFLALAEATAAAAREHHAVVIVNDRADIALMAGAAGVHVGQHDLPVAEVRRILGPQSIVGLSTHDEGQVDAALQSTADYIAVGPIYSTTTKDTGYTARGIDMLREIRAKVKLPIVAIGGVNEQNVGQVWRAGANSVAIISDILSAENIAVKIARILRQHPDGTR